MKKSYKLKHHVKRHLHTSGIAAAILLSATFGTAKAESAGSPAQTLTGQLKTWLTSGRASWYGLRSAGHRTANGEMFNPNGLTAAHRSLPFGTLLRVTNTQNQKSVIVKVNDRGPVPKSRILDLSPAAARQLGFTAAGTASITMELLSPAMMAELHTPGIGR